MTADQHPHYGRIHRLVEVGVHLDYEVSARINADHYKPRSADEIAADEVLLTALEVEHAQRFVEKRRKDRADGIKALDLQITAADADLLARETHTETRAIKAVRRWLETDQPEIAISGPCGTGKTIAGAYALLRAREARRSGDYVRALAFARLFLAQFGPEVAERERLIDGPDLLVIDDVGTEQRADLMGMALVEALDARRRGQRTIVITNLSRAAFEARYCDERLLSRMAQSASWCVAAGADLRRGDA